MTIKEQIADYNNVVIKAYGETTGGQSAEVARALINKLKEENEKLKDRLEIAVEALSKLKFHELEDFQWEIIDKALNQIEE